MQPRTLMWLFVLVGSVVGGYIPTLWGANLFSFSSIFFSTLCAFGGLWLAFQISRNF